jgi:hypothetical protein
VVGVATALRAAAAGPWLERARPVAGYAIGIAAAFWLVERLAGFAV